MENCFFDCSPESSRVINLLNTYSLWLIAFLIVNNITYVSFDDVTVKTNDSVNFHFLYTGRESDPETGLNYKRGRYYDNKMSKFSIKLLSDFYFEPDSNEKYQYGEIVIGDFKEKFLSSLSFWSSEDYTKHWTNSLKKLDLRNKSGLIIDMYNPEKSKTIEWWILYKTDTLVYLQNSLLFLEDLNSVFKIDKIIEYIPERQTYSDDGELISEWCILLKSIEEFIANHY